MVARSTYQPNEYPTQALTRSLSTCSGRASKSNKHDVRANVKNYDLSRTTVADNDRTNEGTKDYELLQTTKRTNVGCNDRHHADDRDHGGIII